MNATKHPAGCSCGDPECPEFQATQISADETAVQVGTRVGAAMARVVLADADLSREWTGIEAQDADQFTAAGLEPGSAAWQEAEESAESEYRRLVK